MLGLGVSRDRALAGMAVSLAAVPILAGGVASAGTVKTEGGMIQGTAEEGISVYRGVP